jgi:hypothetical protein
MHLIKFGETIFLHPRLQLRLAGCTPPSLPPLSVHVSPAANFRSLAWQAGRRVLGDKFDKFTPE